MIVRKELRDAVSNRVFLFSLGILFLSLIYSGYYSGYQYKLNLEWITQSQMYPSPQDIPILFIPYMVPNINLLGALVAIVYGFDVVNKERVEGSLKVLLSYPIYRDEVILGKLVASICLVSLVTIFSLLMSLGVYLFTTGFMLTLDTVMRLAVFGLLTVLVLSGWIGLSVFLSLVFKDAKTTLLILLLMVGLSESQIFDYIGQIVSHVAYGSTYFLLNGEVEINMVSVNLMNFISSLLPSVGYNVVSSQLSSTVLRDFVGDQMIYTPNSMWNVFVNNAYSLLILLLTPLITFIASYVVFTRHDIE